MARIRTIKPEFWDSPELQGINCEFIGNFAVKPQGWGRWRHFPGIPDRPAEYVYFISDSDGNLIYIGKTGNMRGRMQGHLRKNWWDKAASVSVYLIPGNTNTDAEFNAWDVERVAIEYFQPSGNQRPGGTPRTSRFMLDPYGRETIEELRGRGVGNAHPVD